MSEDSKKPMSIGKDKAIELAESEFWKDLSYRERAEFQLSVRELCMPFGVFHEAVEKALGRPVWTHEFGLNWNGLLAEIQGDAPKPSFEDIINLIPAEKCLMVVMDSAETRDA